MAPRRAIRCGVCTSQDSKYSCPACLLPYCSVKCFKDHKSSSCSSGVSEPVRAPDKPYPSPKAEPEAQLRPEEEEIPDETPLKPLTSLKWPYIPEGPSFLDPLKRDEPKPLQLHHYEAIATSSAIRSALSSNPALSPLLEKLDKLRGTDREEALERLLGVTTGTETTHSRRAILDVGDSEEDTKALKLLAEAVEKIVREKPDALGLDWAEDS